MEGWLFLFSGLMLMAAGAVLALRPSIVSYIAENYNRRTVEFLARLGFRHFLDTFPAEVRRMKIFLPPLFFIIGLGWCIFGIRKL